LHIINNQSVQPHTTHKCSPKFNVKSLNHSSKTATCLVQIVVTGL